MTSPSSPLQAVYWSCGEALALASHIGSSPDLPSAFELKQRFLSLLEQVAEKATRAGLSREDMEDIRYAIVAFIDEQVLQSPWDGKQEWMMEPLQLEYFNETTAGEGFFSRLAVIESRPERVHVMQVYYLCLVLGFQGVHAIKNPEALEARIETLAAKLSAQLPAQDRISPHGIPADSGRQRASKSLPIIHVGVAIVLLSIVAYSALRIAIMASASDAASTIQQTASSIPISPSEGK